MKLKGGGPLVVVDDDPDFQILIKAVYESSNIPNELVVFSSGQDCLKYLALVAEDQKPMPAMVLLDLNMPGMDGLETLRRIREQKEFKEIPVITMLSSSNDEWDIELSLKNGANEYQVKPFAFDEYVEFLNSLL